MQQSECVCVCVMIELFARMSLISPHNISSPIPSLDASETRVQNLAVSFCAMRNQLPDEKTRIALEEWRIHVRR